MLFVNRYGESGPLLVLLHGGPGAAGYLAPVARELSDAYRVLEPFQRESGRTPLTVARHVEDLHELMRSLDGETPLAILGSSWGAMLALAYAAAHPDPAVPLILVGCGTFDPVARARMMKIIEQRMDEETRRRMERAWKTSDENARLRAIADAEMPLYCYEAVAGLEAARYDARAYRETWDDMMRLQIEGIFPAAFASVTAPVLMVHGAHDPHPGRLIRDSLLPYLPQLEYVGLARCGHYPWLERSASEHFYSLVRRWLSKHVPGRGNTEP